MLTPGGAPSVPPATARHFDAGALRPGDTFGDLRVVDVDVQRVFEDSVWTGRVRFAGEIVITGELRRHFDWPEPAELCFWVTEPSSIERIPEFAPDPWTSPDGQTWFCFTNPERVRELLGDGAEPVPVTIVVDDYVSNRQFSDTYDTARLVEVVSRGARTSAAAPRGSTARAERRPRRGAPARRGLPRARGSAGRAHPRATPRVRRATRPRA